MNYNMVIMAGRMTRDPQYWPAENGKKSLAKFSLAVKPAQANAESEFYNFVAFGNVADAIHKYFGKGKSIHVTGRLKQEKWTDRATGQSKSTMVIYVLSFTFTDDVNKEAFAGGGDQAQGDSQVQAKETAADLPDGNSDDLPF